MRGKSRKKSRDKMLDDAVLLGCATILIAGVITVVVLML